MKNKTLVQIGGMNFHITWENENVGYDQKGIKWINKNSPECTNKEIIDIAIEFYNKTKQFII